MIRTPVWPASWKARIRCSGMPRPTWMSGEVTSIPSLTRSGRPSASLRSSPPSGRTSTALRVSSSISPPTAADSRRDWQNVVRRTECDARSEGRTQGSVRSHRLRTRPRTQHRDEQRAPGGTTMFRRALLEVVRQEALGAEGIPHAEGEADEPDGGRDAGEGATGAGRAERQPPTRREKPHRERRAEGEEGEGGDGESVARNRREEQDADTGAPAHPVHDPDRVSAERRAALRGMPMSSRARVYMRVRVLAVEVCMGVKGTAAPADEKPDREPDDQEAHRRLGRPLHGLREVRAVEDDRQPEREQRGGVPEAPREAERTRAARRALLARGDECRHCGQVVQVSRVAKAEHDRHEDDDEERRPVRERSDPLVEPEHPHATFGSARAVIATPATRITSALTAGRRPTSRPSKLARANRRFARTAAIPMPVIESARPALKATIRSRPNATRWSEIAASRTTSADGHGRRPPETPTPTRERQPRLSPAPAWWW